MSSKQAALDLAPAAIASTASTAKPPDKFTYALPAFTVQRRKTGWRISPTRSAGEKSEWSEEALHPIYRELHAIRDDLEDLRHRVKDMAGYRKEIDYAFERIAAIEKHLGIDRKQVA
jgi:hypothetical protein